LYGVGQCPPAIRADPRRIGCSAVAVLQRAKDTGEPGLGVSTQRTGGVKPRFTARSWVDQGGPNPTRAGPWIVDLRIRTSAGALVHGQERMHWRPRR